MRAASLAGVGRSGFPTSRFLAAAAGATGSGGRWPECGGRMLLIAFIAEATVAKRILDHLRLESTGPPLVPARGGLADCVDPAPVYDVADPVYES